MTVLFFFFLRNQKFFVSRSEEVRCFRCLCVCVLGPRCFTAPDVTDFRDSAHRVRGVAITETDTAEEKWSGPINQAHFNWIHRFLEKKNYIQIFFFSSSSAAVKLKHDCVCLYLFLITQSSLSYVLRRPATAKHFTSCWCQARSLYLFLSPQKSCPAPVFMIKLWLLGRHLDSSVIDDGC